MRVNPIPFIPFRENLQAEPSGRDPSLRGDSVVHREWNQGEPFPLLGKGSIIIKKGGFAPFFLSLPPLPLGEGE